MDAARNDSPALVFADGYSYTEFFLCQESTGVIFTRIFHAMFEPMPPASRRREATPASSESFSQ